MQSGQSGPVGGAVGPVRVRGALFWSYATYGVTVGGNIIAVPLYLKAFGSARYGLWISLVDLLGYLGLLNLGISQAVSSRVSRAYGVEDHEAVVAAVKTGFSAYVRTCGVAAPFLMGACWFAPWTRLFHLDPGLASEARWAALLACVTLLMDLPLSILRVALQGLAEVSLTQMVVLSVVVSRLGVAWACARGTPSLPVGIAALWACNLAGHGANWLLLRRKLPPLPLSAKYRSSEVLAGRLRSESIPYFIIQISSTVLFLTDTPITAIALGAGNAARVAVASRMTMSIIGIGALVGPAVAPSLVLAWARGDTESARSIGVRGARDLIAIVTGASLVALAFGERIFAAWVGPDMFIGTLAWTIYCAYVAIQGPTMIPDAFLMQAGVSRQYAFVACAEAALKIGLSIALLRLMGLAGLPTALLLARAATRLWYLPYTYASRLDMPLASWLRQAGRPSIVASLAFFVCYVPVRIFAAPTDPATLLAGAVGAVAFGVVYLYGRRALERERIRPTSRVVTE